MIAHHLAQLATTIDITLDSAACDGQLGALDTAQSPPIYHVDISCTVLFVEITHAASKDVAALGVGHASSGGVKLRLRNVVMRLPLIPIPTCNLGPLSKVGFCDSIWRIAACTSLRNNILISITNRTATDGDVYVATTLDRKSVV